MFVILSKHFKHELNIQMIDYAQTLCVKFVMNLDIDGLFQALSFLSGLSNIYRNVRGI